jgi:hypothetical protein
MGRPSQAVQRRVEWPLRCVTYGGWMPSDIQCDNAYAPCSRGAGTRAWAYAWSDCFPTLRFTASSLRSPSHLGGDEYRSAKTTHSGTDLLSAHKANFPHRTGSNSTKLVNPAQQHAVEVDLALGQRREVDA